MVLEEFRILLDSPVYYTGQKITGKLVVQLTKAKQVKGISIIYSGCGFVQWKYRTSNKTEKRRDEEEFLDLEQQVFGNGEDDSELAAGRHVFAFYCDLPLNLPCSYKGKFGRIRYTVMGKIHGSSMFNYDVEQSITILSVFDLNCLPIAAAPVSETKSKKVGKRSKMLHMSFDLPVRGFVPGQIIPITVSINNQSMVRVKNLIATLCQNVTFRVDMAVRRSKTRLSKTQFAIDEAFGFHEVLLNIDVPPLPPSYLEFCKFIDYRYHLTVEADIATVRKNLKIHTEILIGNVPLMTYQKPISGRQPSLEPVDLRHPSFPSQSSVEQPPFSPPSFPQLALYGHFSLPMYEQIVELKPSEESNPDLVYPVYKFPGSRR